jgi:hypothetical protein
MQTGDTQPLAAYEGNYLIDAYMATADAILNRQPAEAPEAPQISLIRRLLKAIGFATFPSESTNS